MLKKNNTDHHPTLSSSIFWGLLFLLLLFPSVAFAELKIVATLPTLASIANEIGGEHVNVKRLVSWKQDPHFADARPDFIIKLNRADLLLLNGLSLEVGWLPPLMSSARNPAIQKGSQGYFDASAFVDLLGGGGSDRSRGDVHAGGNPHFLQDPRALVKVADALAQRLGVLDPEHATEFTQRAATFRASMETFAASEKQRFQDLSPAKRLVVVYHDSMPYLADWLGLKIIATIEPKPGISPNPAHVMWVLKVMKSRKIKVILQEGFYPTKTSKQLAKLSKSTIVVLPGGVNLDAGENCLQYLQSFSSKLYEAIQ